MNTNAGIRPNIVLEDSSLICDNKDCDFTDPSITIYNMHLAVNRPCPKCGQNLLTQSDYKLAQSALAAAAIINSMDLEQIKDNEKPKTWELGMHNGITINEKQ